MAQHYFEGLATRYDRFRPGIPPEACSIIGELADAERPTLLDLGTGTGQLVFDCGARFQRIVGVELDADMLAIARRKSEESAVLRERSVEWVVASAEEFLTSTDESFDVATICRAFHWLDQEGVLRLLDRTVAPAGHVVVCGDGSLWNASDDWAKMVKTTVQDFLGEQRRVRSGTFTHHDRPYLEIMRESPFADAVKRDVSGVRSWSIDQVLGYLFSTTFAAPELFGDRLGEFEQTVRDRLSKYAADSDLRESFVFTLVIGRRPLT